MTYVEKALREVMSKVQEARLLNAGAGKWQLRSKGW